MWINTHTSKNTRQKTWFLNLVPVSVFFQSHQGQLLLILSGSREAILSFYAAGLLLFLGRQGLRKQFIWNMEKGDSFFEVHDSTMHKWHFIVFMKRYFFKYMIYNIHAYAQTLYNRYLHELHRNKLSVTCVKETSRECWRGATPFFALRRWYIHMLGCPVSFWTFSGVTFADFFFMFLFTQTWYLIQERWERSSGKDWKIPYCSIEGLCADTGVLGGSQRCSFVIQIFRGGDPIWIHFVGTLFDC